MLCRLVCVSASDKLTASPPGFEALDDRLLFLPDARVVDSVVTATVEVAKVGPAGVVLCTWSSPATPMTVVSPRMTWECPEAAWKVAFSEEGWGELESSDSRQYTTPV